MARKRRKKAAEEFVHYAMAPSDWDYRYWFRFGNKRYDAKPYEVLALIEFSGELKSPRDATFRRVKVTLSASASMREDTWETRGTGIGGLTVRGDELEAYIFVPSEHFSELASIVSSGRIKTVEFSGTKIKRRNGTALSLSIDTRNHVDETDDGDAGGEQ